VSETLVDDNGVPIPRRCFVEKRVAAETAIAAAMAEVEKMGADVRLTRAVILLGEAKNAVGDYVDGLATPAPSIYPLPEPISQNLQAILDLADARLRNPQDLTPNTEHDLREISRLANEALG
jgi:hypothetical protein